jgi:hypothetical protein
MLDLPHLKNLNIRIVIAANITPSCEQLLPGCPSSTHASFLGTVFETLIVRSNEISFFGRPASTLRAPRAQTNMPYFRINFERSLW